MVILKTEEELESFREAGRIQSKVRTYAAGLIKPGVLLREVAEKAEEKLLQLGGEFGFPAQISRNHIAAHYCSAPDDKTVFEKGDLVKFDVGVHVNGCIADAAVTVDLGKNEKLKNASLDALNNAIKIVQSGVTVCEIGRVVQETIQKAGFSPVRNLCGHGVGIYVVHEAPSIPNYDNGSKVKLQHGQVIAIEPFASAGAGIVYEQEEAEVFMLAGKKPVRNMITRAVLKDIEKFHGLPFAVRWLLKNHTLAKINFALKELDDLGILHKYPPLPDRAKGLVSQHEHTMVAWDGSVEVLTK